MDGKKSRRIGFGRRVYGTYVGLTFPSYDAEQQAYPPLKDLRR